MNDIVNSIFEFIGGITAWVNCYKVFKDKKIRGVFWPFVAFFTLWGFWNL